MVDYLNSLISDLALPWQIFIFIIGLVIGIFFLVKFCNYFVDSASVIAKKLKIPPIIIGLTIVAMGTSLPELAVSISDSISTLNGGAANVAIGNVIGSNIGNILLVLGLSVIFTPIIVKKSVRQREIPILFGVTILCVIMICFFGGKAIVGDVVVTRIEGIILTLLIIAYTVYLIIMAKKFPEQQSSHSEIKNMPLWKAIILLIVGAAGIILGGQLIVFGAKGITLEFSVALGLDENLAGQLVGLTVVAVGTSLPELVTSLVSAKKGQNELAIGNVIGSNIFNILAVLGISAIINPLTSENHVVIVDVLFMLVTTIMLWIMCAKGKLTKSHGIILVSCYAVYLVYLILRTLLGWSF